MNGKILYVEDDASKACESFLTGLLSDLIVPELKQEIENKSGIPFDFNNKQLSNEKF